MDNHSGVSKKVLAIEAHPDDAEFSWAGTLALLHKKGYGIYITSVCTGDKGSKILNPREIASKRFGEATLSAKILDGVFETLGVPDGGAVFDNSTRAKVIEAVRKVDPDIVITMSPTDYMPDHEIASYLAFDACFLASCPNYYTSQPNPSKPMDRIPHLYYADPSELSDHFGQKVLPEFYVDISSVIDIKEKMLSQHASQREWLKAQHNMDDFVKSMYRWSGERGKEVGVKYAEGFRQHKCQPFPKENILKQLVPVIEKIKK